MPSFTSFSFGRFNRITIPPYKLFIITSNIAGSAEVQVDALYLGVSSVAINPQVEVLNETFNIMSASADIHAGATLEAAVKALTIILGKTELECPVYIINATTGVIQCTSDLVSETFMYCSADGAIECLSDLYVSPINLIPIVPGQIDCSAVITNETLSLTNIIGRAIVDVLTFTSHTATVALKNKTLLAGRSYSPNEVYIVAFDASDEEKKYANYICTGAKDEEMFEMIMDLNRARTGVTLRCSSGHFYFTRSLNVKNYDIVGDGPTKTIFEFVSDNNTPDKMFNINIGLIVRSTGTTTLDGFAVTGNGTLKVVYEDSENTVFNIRNIHGTNWNWKKSAYYHNKSIGKIMAEVAYPLSRQEYTEIPAAQLNIENCKVFDTDYCGFAIYGDARNDKYARTLSRVSINNCYAITCGKFDSGKSVVAGFNLLKNVSVESIHVKNSYATDCWHSGFYFSDARMRYFIANGYASGYLINRNDYDTNFVYNLYMDNCHAAGNGIRSNGFTQEVMKPYCSGFVLREFSVGSAKIADIPQFVQYVDGIKTVVLPVFPDRLEDRNGPGVNELETLLQYGNVVNCHASNNKYAGFITIGNNWNKAELNLVDCYASGSEYGLYIERHSGIHIRGLVCDYISTPAVMIKYVDEVTVSDVRIVDSVAPVFVSFEYTSDNKVEYESLPIEATRFITVED